MPDYTTCSSKQKTWLLHHWYDENSTCYLLKPLAWLFRWIVQIRHQCYRLGVFKTTRFSVPIVVVGNITLGGTGKTPLVIALVHLLRAHGFKPGIVSRGYGGKSAHYPMAVSQTSDPKQVGDEAVLLATKTQVPLYISPKRVEAVQALLTQHDCNVVITDDGLQHDALARDIEIVVIDGKRRFGNAQLLPAGPLREPITRLNTVDFIVTNGTARDGEFGMQLQGVTLHAVINTRQTFPMAYFQGKCVHAVAAIGHPERFFETLKQKGLSLKRHIFPDHYLFKKEDFDFLSPGECVIMTEKDAVKCRDFATENFFYLPVEAVLESTFESCFIEKLNQKRLSYERKKY